MVEYYERKQNKTKIKKEAKYLKDEYAKKLLKEEDCKEYVASIIASVLDLPKDYVVNNLKLLNNEININEHVKNQEADAVFDLDEHIVNIEINYNNSIELQTKNTGYIAQLYLTQIKPGENYPKIKPIVQINLNNYDVFNKNEFIYHSVVMETKHHIIRNKDIEIFDINIDLLNEIDYNEIEKLNERDLRWLLYIFVCGDKRLREEVYGESEMMKKVNDKIDDYQAFLNRWLYYDKEYLDNCGIRYKFQIETAKKLLQMKLGTDEQIAKATGLDLERIEKLKKEKE